MRRRIGVAALTLGIIGLVPPAAHAGPAPSDAGRTAPATTTTAEASPAPAPVATRGVDAQTTWRRTAAVSGPAETDTGTADATPRGAAAALALTVAPDSDLVRGQTVTVSGVGYPVGRVAVVQCSAGVSPAYRCDLSGLRFLDTDAAGSFSTDFVVHRVINSPDGRLDCATAPGACELVTADQAAAILARHALAFDPDEPLPTPSIAVTPSTGLLDRQSVTVTGAGFLPNDQVDVRQCAAGAGYCYGNGGIATTDATGAFSIPVTLRLAVVGVDELLTTCLAVQCLLQASSFSDIEYLAEVPLTFDPTQPIPPGPSVTVEPATGLVHNQQVTVTGTGYPADSFIEIIECVTVELVSCSDYLTDLQADGSGRFSTTVTVSRLVRYFDRDAGILDCAAADCSVRASAYDEGDGLPYRADAAIEFDPNVPLPPPPTATVTPSTDLPYRTQLIVHGEGFTPGAFVSADYCILGTESGTCPSYATGAADQYGTVDLTITVTRRAFGGGVDGIIDCIDPETECTVSVYGRHAYEQVEIPLEFDPDAPIPPPPTVTLSPEGPFGWRQAVGVAGAGFPPGFIAMAQCGRFEVAGTTYENCDGYTTAEVNADGFLLALVTVRRHLNFGPGSPIDCATAQCTLRVGFEGPDGSATIPLQFDPNSQPPPPPVLTFAPDGALFDGRVVTVHGTGWTPNALVGITECRAGVTSIADACAITDVFTATADGAGTFAVPYRPIGATGTAQGPLDCTTGPGSCVLAAANAGERSEFVTVPLTFDAPELTVRSTTVTEGTVNEPTDPGHHHLTSPTAPPSPMNLMDPNSPDWTEAHVMVGISEPIGSDMTVEWHTTPGTATEDDYLPRHGRVTIPAGETEAMIHAKVMPDTMHEPSERFSVDIGVAPGATIVDGNASVKIRNDDDPPMVTVSDNTGYEGKSSVRAWVRLSNPSHEPVVVRWVTHHGTAVSGSDYDRSKGDILFAPGETRHRVRVGLIDDTTREQGEWFTVKAHDADGAEIGRAEARIIIRDDD